MNSLPREGRTSAEEWPEHIRDETELDEYLTRPRPVLLDFIRTVSSPLLVLGAGGKMGPTLAVLAKQAAVAASHNLEVIAVSRFSNPSLRQWLESRGVSTVNCDLFDAAGLATLPEANNLVYLVGLKFGTQHNPALTWAVNTVIPARVMERYPKARLVALSTGNVYPLVPVAGGGAREDHPLTPVGEYANSAVARERIFQFYSQRQGARVALMRLNYAVELRYGVLLDIARKVWKGETIDLRNGFFNCIWQGDANEMILRALKLAAAPAEAWNLTSPGVLRVREVADRFGELLKVAPKFAGCEGESALLNNPARICEMLGKPPTPLECVMRWTAHWVQQGGRSLDKPTHFEVRDGQY